MLVNSLGNNKIKITLTAYEISKLFGSYENIDYSNPEIKIALNILLDKAIKISSTKFDDGALFVEVYPTALGGCNIYFTRINQTNKQQNRFKKATHNNLWNVLEFEKSNDLLNAIELLYITNETNIFKSSLYKHKDKYYLLVVCSKSTDKRYCFIKEFAKTIYSGKEICSFFDEHYSKIIPNNAIEKIGKSLNNNICNYNKISLNLNS